MSAEVGTPLALPALASERDEFFQSPVADAFFKVLSSATAPTCGVDKDGKVAFWNSKMEFMTSIPASHVLGQPLLDQFAGRDAREQARKSLELALHDGVETAETTLRIVTADGLQAHFWTNLTPIIDSTSGKDEIVGVYAIGQDVTDWAGHERQYAEVVNHGSASIVELDTEGRVTAWNPSVSMLTGYTSAEMIGESILRDMPEEYHDVIYSHIEECVRLVKPSPELEMPLRSARTEEVHLMVSFTPRVDANGDVFGVMIIGHDITERKAKERVYEKFIDSANTNIVGVDMEGRTVIFNQSSCQATEYSVDEVMGKDLVELLVPVEYRDAVAAAFQEAYIGNEVTNFEFSLKKKSGKRFEVLLNITPWFDHLGRITGAVGIGQDITDRIIQEQEHRRLIDTANAPIFGVDSEFKITSWNKKAATITQYPVEYMMGKNIAFMVVDEFKSALFDILSKAFDGHETANFEMPVMTRSGQRRIILLNATPRSDHVGNIVGAVGIGQDITERRTQEQEYTRLIDTANAPIFGVDRDLSVNIWNRKAARITEYPGFDVLGANLVESFIPKEYQEKVGGVLEQALVGVETANFEFPLISRTGRRVEILLNATPRYDEQGEIIGVVGIGQDITDRIMQEREYSRLIDTANAPIVGVDKDGLVTIWNRKAAEITQFSGDEVVGEDLVQQFVSEDAREAVESALNKALDGAQTAIFDFPLTTKTGRRVEILLNATPRYNEMGQIVGVVGIGQDITERLAQEQEFTRLIDTANAPIFGVDADGLVNIWNRKAAEITQYTNDDVMGENLVEKFITEDYRKAVGYVLDKALDGTETANFEFPLITKTGRRVEILLNATSRFNEHGQVKGMVGIGQDITDRIAQEQEYTRLIDTANAPIFGVDQDGRVNIWNRKAAEITQYTPKDVMGENLVEKFITEGYKEAVGFVLDKALSGKETANFEFPLMTKAGRRVEILLNATSRYNELGEVKGMVGIGQDITDRIAQEQEYTRLIDTANAPIFGVDAEGRVNIWNRKAAEIMQYTSSDVMGEHLVEKFITEGYKQAVGSVLNKALLGSETANFAFPLITKTGRRVEILLNATSRYNELGEVKGVVGIGQDITDRIAQEQEYTRLIDTANAPIFGVDASGRVNIWNRKAAEVTLHSPSDVMGENLVEKFITEGYKEAVGDVLQKALNGTETANFEFPLMTKTGRRVEILLNATPRYNEHGQVKGMVGIGQDITDRIAQEQEYTRLIDTANAPIFGMDADGLVNIWNRKAAEITQYSNEDVMGEHLVNKFITDDYKEAVGYVLSKALEGKETANFEFPLMTKAGRRVEILLNATSRYNEHGQVIGMVGIGQDITDRIAQEQEYTRLIDTANAPIFGVDSNGRVNIWNRKAAEITQYTNDDVMGENLVEKFITEGYKEAVASVLSKALEDVETANFEFPLMTKVGRRLEILLNATPRYNEHGQVMGMVGIGQDITDRIAQEQEYTRLIDTANAPIFGVDSRGLVNIWNRKAAEITQHAPSDVMGEHLVNKFITEGYKQAVGSVLRKALGGAETANFEFPLMTKTGRRVEILLNATPRYNEHGQVIGMVGIGQDITDRIAQEQEYTRLIDTANAPIFGVDAEGRVNIWNRKAAEITQYTSKDVMGEHLVNKFITEGYKDAVGFVLRNALEGQETANFEFPLMTKAGRRVEILLNATSRYNEHGRVKGMVGIGQDITNRIAQEQEYTRLIDTANAPIFGVDSEGLVNIWNRKAAEITQYSNGDVVGEHLVNKFITKDYKEAVGSVLRKALAGFETANFEFPLITKAGSRVEILLNATPRYNEHGQVIGMVGIGQDITERIAQEQEYTRLIDKANAPIFGVDMDGRLNIWNNKAAHITQYSREEVMGESLVDNFIAEENRALADEVVRKALQGDESSNFEILLMTKTERKLNILLNAAARFDQHGQIVGIVGIGQDITDRIAQEQEYTRLIDTANAPIFGVDSKGCVNIWNKKAAEITQYTTDHVLGQNLVDKFITEDYREAVGSVLDKALSGAETANFEFPLITRIGRRLDILLNATSRFNEHGQVIGMVGIGQDISDRIAQEQEYSRLIDTANAPIFGVDSEYKVIIWNRKAAHITQYTNAEVLGEDLINKFISEEYRDLVRNVFSQALSGVETANFEFPLITKGNRRVEILLNATPKFGQQGDIVGVVGIGQDITDRLAQEQEYSRLIDTANAPIFGVDADMCVNIWNKKAAQITNYSIQEVMGENLVETFISPEFRPIVAEVLSKALQGIQTANFEFPLITRPGTRIEILLNATPRNDSNGNIVGVVGIGQDITDRIAQEHEYFRLIDTANAPIFGVDTNGCINEWNQKIEEITGYHKSTVLGLSLVHTFIIPESRKQVRQLLNQALIGIDVGEMELPMTTKRGAFLLLLVNASSKKDMHGNIRGVIGVGQDYTARKQMEAAKVNFLASFSHELRTPLNGVLGMLELLKEAKLEETSQRYVNMAYVSGSLLLNLINDILDLSKIEAGQLEISAAPFEMQDLLEYSIEIFKFRARDRGLKLELECDKNVPSDAIGDVFRLRQVLLNLLSNAIKFTNEGGVTVKCSVVRAPELPATFRKLLFQVIDTGIGMDAEEKQRLFSLFTKLERTRQNNPTGSGLGLAICKQLVELMDGQIDVDSELSVGSNFFFTVVVRLLNDEVDPMYKHMLTQRMLNDNGNIRVEDEPPESEPKDQDQAFEPVSSDTGKVNKNGANIPDITIPDQVSILVVEDNEFNWEVVKCFLQEEDHRLQWEVNGRDAVEAYKVHHESFDMIFMDCEMPVMDGYAAATAIRQFEATNHLPRIPVLGLTAYAMSGDRQKCLDAGMDEFMVKPIPKNTLLKAIHQWIRVRVIACMRHEDPDAFPPEHYSAEWHSLGSNSAETKPKKSITFAPEVSRSSSDFSEKQRRGSFRGMDEYNEQLEDKFESNSRKLVPASQHMQQLDLARAISNLELDDPMAINRQGNRRTYRVAAPATSIFSLGTNSSSKSTSNSDILNFRRDGNGSIIETPDWMESDVTSTTFPATLDRNLQPTTADDQVKPTVDMKDPTLWSHPPFKREMPPRESVLRKMKSADMADSIHSNGNESFRFPGLVEVDEEDEEDEEDKRKGSMSDSAITRMSPAAAYNPAGKMESPQGLNLAEESKAPQSEKINSTIGPKEEATPKPKISPMDIEIPEGDPVDVSRGVQQCGGVDDLFMKLLEKFAINCGNVMAKIFEAHEINDYATLRRESHSLKGSASYVAASRVSKAAYRVQLASEQVMNYQEEHDLPTNDPRMIDPALKKVVDDSLKVLKKERTLLFGYLRRNYEFKNVLQNQQQQQQPRSSPASTKEERKEGNCGVM